MVVPQNVTTCVSPSCSCLRTVYHSQHVRIHANGFGRDVVAGVVVVVVEGGDVDDGY